MLKTRRIVHHGIASGIAGIRKTARAALWLVLLAATLLAGAQARAESAATLPTSQPATQPTTQPTLKFMRFVNDPRHPVFQTGLLKLHNDEKNVDVTLVAAVHVGDKAYYHDLNDRFAKFDAVLFEMVKPEGSSMPSPEMMKSRKPSSWVGVVQGGIKDVLDLGYQLEEVDYTRDNFVHADLTAEQFEEMQNQRGESILGTLAAGSWHQMLSGEGMDLSDSTGMQILAALASPDRPRQLKLILADQISKSDTMIEKMEGKEGSVLLTERNKAALRAMNEQIDKGKKNLAIFYGAAHLKIMAQQLETQGFKQVGDVQWLTAWDMTAATTQPTTKTVK